VRLQDLFLILSQGVDLGLLSITAALGSARDFKQILGSGFEMIRISQGESLTVCHNDRFESAPEFVTWDLSFGHKIRLFLQLSCKRGVSRAYNRWFPLEN
jgi:hypothetical protein